VSKLTTLKSITTKKELADLLEIKRSNLTYTLYVLKPSTQYFQFQIPKKNGGFRTIDAPAKRLKDIQSKLSDLFLDCIDEINKGKEKNQHNAKHGIHPYPMLSHGFSRKKSIITNALMHVNNKNVLNLDLDDFFDSFNFGRVRGFFIKNRNFELHPDIATVIAQIACYNNKLPQGSPCSPVITNLITHSLDIKLASLGRRYSCTYSRYADDITFSTREEVFPHQLMAEDNGKYTPGKRLRREIESSGFTINSKKTRIQYKDSRQDVTGLIVNKKPNIKKEYWRTAKSQCHSLFRTGTFYKHTDQGMAIGNINELEGQLNFIDQVDFFNRLRQKPPLNPLYKLENHRKNTSNLLTGREKTFSRFLFYRYFYGNSKPTILCEGKTDNVYLKSAINVLQDHYPRLAKSKSKHGEYKPIVHFFNYSKRTRFLLELFGGADYLKGFVENFQKNHSFYKAPKPKNPVILLLDNDSGSNGIINLIKGLRTTTIHPSTTKKDDIKNADFIHIMHNLYLVLTPLNGSNGSSDTAIEDLFDATTKSIKVGGKSFNPGKPDTSKEYGKEIFANRVVKEKKSSINFDGFKPLLNRISAVIEHYSKHT